MCGIAGFSHRTGKPPGRLISEMVQSLSHRGPDDRGTYCGKFAALMAVRLAVVDPWAGTQPFISEDGDTILAFNGEIYNYKELRERLEGHGYRFRTNGDTEVVLQAFRHWGTSCFPMFRGMFALALVIESERRIVLARDRMGIKPLYYYRRGEALHFGSEMKAILADPRVPRRIDRSGLSHYLSLNYVPAPLTLIEGIEKLPPAHWLDWQLGSVRLQRYWSPRDSIRPRMTKQDAVEELDLLLSAAVSEQMQADVPVALWISGGVDSSLILQAAARHATSSLRTFSVRFPGEKHDESRYSRALAAHFGTRHEEYELVGNAGLADAIHSLVHFADEPCADAGAMPLWFLSALTGRDTTVALSGDGADELFGGYQTYLADSLSSKFQIVPRSVRKQLAAWSKLLPVSDEKIGLDYKLTRFLEGSLLSPGQAHFFWNGTFSEQEKRQLCAFGNHPPLSDLYRPLLGRSEPNGIKDFLKIDRKYYLADNILAKCDRISMAHSVEVRPPFLDDRIVDFAGALPPALLREKGQLKPLLKSLLASKLSPALRRRGKQGLDIPIHSWLRGPLRELVRDTLSTGRIEQSGLLNAAYVSSLLKNHLDRTTNVGYHLWGLLILSLWIEHWKIDTSALQQDASIAMAARV